MIGWNRGRVTRVLDRSRPETITVEVEVDRPSGPDHAPHILAALAYTDLVGSPEVGDVVLLNDNAAQAGLGTGAGALVVAIPDRLPEAARPPGHLVKARYTPLQTMILGVDAQESPHHRFLADADSIAGLPVVAADLHSSLPAIVAGIRSVNPALRVVYLMTDGGALPAAFSQTLTGLTRASWLVGTITTGQAFGGDWEAVTVHSGLLAARHVVTADIAVVAQGPGNLGTGTRWGFSGVSAGEALNAAAVLGGTPVASLRISQADARARHLGVSHHSLTAYGRVLNRAADLVVPDLHGADRVPQDLARQVSEQAAALVRQAPHLRLREVAVDGLIESLGDSPVRLSTWGGGVYLDGAAFLSAPAAGRWAAGHC